MCCSLLEKRTGNKKRKGDGMKKAIAMLLVGMFLMVSVNAHADYSTKEDGATIMFVTVLGALAGMVPNAVTFGSGDPTSSAFMMAVTTLTAYSQLPHVRRTFREKKAVNEFGLTEADAKALSDQALIDVIRDVCQGTCQTSGRSDEAFLSAGMLPRLGG